VGRRTKPLLGKTSGFHVRPISWLHDRLRSDIAVLMVENAERCDGLYRRRQDKPLFGFRIWEFRTTECARVQWFPRHQHCALPNLTTSVKHIHCLSELCKPPTLPDEIQQVEIGKYKTKTVSMQQRPKSRTAQTEAAVPLNHEPELQLVNRLLMKV
jgi:hypothetical protein